MEAAVFAYPGVGFSLVSTIRRSPDYLSRLSLVVSSARSSEIVAVDNYSEMVALMPDTEAKIEMLTQAKEECKHILLLEKLAGYVGFPICEVPGKSQWDAFRRHFHSSANKQNLAACLIIQHLMIESLAIGLYQVFASSANGDAGTQRMAASLLQDELRHLGVGVGQIQRLMREDSDRVHEALVWAHGKVMPGLFDVLDELCELLSVNGGLGCDTLVGHGGSVDLALLKLAPLNHYSLMLNQVGFERRVIDSLIAMASDRT
ncbi:MAG TPA: ferritin-like domain-containing protein [Blastocatellia bacterium]|nr:ferritin-like domain-containing protein [Blastocatellia bacterium]